MVMPVVQLKDHNSLSVASKSKADIVPSSFFFVTGLYTIDLRLSSFLSARYIIIEKLKPSTPRGTRHVHRFVDRVVPHNTHQHPGDLVSEPSHAKRAHHDLELEPIGPRLRI